VTSIVKADSLTDFFRNQGHLYFKTSTTHTKVYSTIHRFLTLPFPFPLITSHPIADLLRLAIFVGLNVLWGWNSNQYSGDYRLYGWLTIANGGLALLMAARTNLFSIVARIPSLKILLYHRWIGRATVVHATIHFSLNTRRYLKTDQLSTAYSNRRIQIGIMAWLSLCIMGITSISFMRRRWFEAFYYPHALFFVFVVGASIHATRGPEFLLPGLLLWIADRIIRCTHNFRSVRVISATQHPGDLTKFKIEGLRTTHPGQITWIQVPKVSFLNWHPFTIISAPGDNEAVLAVRGLGGYTQKLQSVAVVAKSQHQDSNSEERGIAAAVNIMKIRLDGPYGVGDIQWGLHPVTILVAGGIGITPGMSIAMHIIKNIKLSDEAIRDGQKLHIHLLWIVKDRVHIQWFEDELKELTAVASDPLVPVTFDVKIHVTGNVTLGQQSTGPAETYGLAERYEYQGPGLIVQGRPNMVQWFNEVKNTRQGMDAVVNACGPRSMINDVRKAAAKESGKGGVFHVSEEVFEI
jgi:NADPH oxidase 2